MKQIRAGAGGDLEQEMEGADMGTNKKRDRDGKLERRGAQSDSLWQYML